MRRGDLKDMWPPEILIWGFQGCHGSFRGVRPNPGLHWICHTVWTVFMRGAGSCAVVRGWTNQTPSEPHALTAAGRTSTATTMIKSLAATPLSTALQFWATAAVPLFFLLFKYLRDLFPALYYSHLYPNTPPWLNEISQRRLVRTPTASDCNVNIKKPLLFGIWITTGKKKPFQGIGWSLTHPQYRGG